MDRNCYLVFLLALTIMTSLTTPGVYCDPVSGLTTTIDTTDPVLLTLGFSLYREDISYTQDVKKSDVCQEAAKKRKGTDILVLNYHVTADRKFGYTTGNCKGPKTVDTYPCRNFVSIQCDPQSIVYLTRVLFQEITISDIDTRYVTEHECSTTVCDTISEIGTDTTSLLTTPAGEEDKRTTTNQPITSLTTSTHPSDTGITEQRGVNNGDKDNTTVIVSVIVSTAIAVVIIVVVVAFLLYWKISALISNAVAGHNTGQVTDPETDASRHGNTVNNTEGANVNVGMYDVLGTTNNNENNNYYNRVNTTSDSTNREKTYYSEAL